MKRKEEHEMLYACPPTQIADQAELGLKIVIPSDGYITGNCMECGMQVWIGPRQQAAMQVRPGRVQCFKCSLAQGHLNIMSLGGEGASYIKKGPNDE